MEDYNLLSSFGFVFPSSSNGYDFGNRDLEDESHPSYQIMQEDEAGSPQETSLQYDELARGIEGLIQECAKTCDKQQRKQMVDDFIRLSECRFSLLPPSMIRENVYIELESGGIEL